MIRLYGRDSVGAHEVLESFSIFVALEDLDLGQVLDCAWSGSRGIRGLSSGGEFEGAAVEDRELLGVDMFAGS